jgi:hypothetical protein
MDLGIRNHLIDIARLVPKSSIRIDVLEELYPSGELVFTLYVLNGFISSLQI